MTLRIIGPRVPGADQILTPEACRFVEKLVQEFRSAIASTLVLRNIPRTSFLARTAHMRESDWQVPLPPADLRDRRVEITGPASSRKMDLNALNSGANVFMADSEDSESPTWANIVNGQINLRDAVRRTISLDTPDKKYRLNSQIATLMFRPRGWHLPERHVLVDDQPAPASLVDFSLFFCHNVRELLSRGSGVYLYLPKIENWEESLLWDQVLEWSEDYFRVPRGSTRTTMLIETLPAAFQMEEILYAQRGRASGLNAGRWDMIFSYIKTLGHDPAYLLPDRSQVTMDKAFLAAYARLLVQTCHKRGVHAMGGMSAFIPLKDPKQNEAVFEKVRADKLREAKLGHDGAWVAHPGLVSLVRDVFDKNMYGLNQTDFIPGGIVTEEMLREPHKGTITYEGLATNLKVGVQYLTSWLKGVGCVPINNLMEDAATAEISRTQVWQWLRHGARMDDGRKVTFDLVDPLLANNVNNENSLATTLMRKLINTQECPDFLTLPAYDRLVDSEV